MEKEYFMDTLFDLINESDALEADLQDLCADRRRITVTMKDGAVFILTLTGSFSDFRKESIPKSRNWN